MAKIYNAYLFWGILFNVLMILRNAHTVGKN